MSSAPHDVLVESAPMVMRLGLILSVLSCLYSGLLGFAQYSPQAQQAPPGTSPVGYTFVHNSQFNSLGFWGAGPPERLERAPRTYYPAYDRLPILSEACAPQRDPVACAAYTEVDVFIALSDEVDVQTIAEAVREHPYSDHAERRHYLISTQATNMRLVADTFQTLLNSCKVVRYALFSGHGYDGKIQLDIHELPNPASDFIARSKIACALAPRAKIQFNNCDMACHYGHTNGAVQLRDGLQQVLTDPALNDRGESPFRDIQFLFNTSEGIVDLTLGLSRILGRLHIPDFRGRQRVLTQGDANDRAIIFGFGIDAPATMSHSNPWAVPECGTALPAYINQPLE